MKKNRKLFFFPSFVLVLTIVLTLAPSKIEVKGLGLDKSYVSCLEVAPGQFEKAVYEDVYVFWIRIQYEPTGAWVNS